MFWAIFSLIFAWLVPAGGTIGPRPITNSVAPTDNLYRVMTELENYAANNNGEYPIASADTKKGFVVFSDKYLVIIDSLSGTTFSYTDGTEPSPNTNQIRYHSGSTGYVCDGDRVVAGTSKRQIALTALTSSGVLCVSNK